MIIVHPREDGLPQRPGGGQYVRLAHNGGRPGNVHGHDGKLFVGSRIFGEYTAQGGRHLAKIGEDEILRQGQRCVFDADGFPARHGDQTQRPAGDVRIYVRTEMQDTPCLQLDVGAVFFRNIGKDHWCGDARLKTQAAAIFPGDAGGAELRPRPFSGGLVDEREQIGLAACQHGANSLPLEVAHKDTVALHEKSELLSGIQRGRIGQEHIWGRPRGCQDKIPCGGSVQTRVSAHGKRGGAHAGVAQCPVTGDIKPPANLDDTEGRAGGDIRSGDELSESGSRCRIPVRNPHLPCCEVPDENVPTIGGHVLVRANADDCASRGVEGPVSHLAPLRCRKIQVAGDADAPQRRDAYSGDELPESSTRTSQVRGISADGDVLDHHFPGGVLNLQRHAVRLDQTGFFRGGDAHIACGLGGVAGSLGGVAGGLGSCARSLCFYYFLFGFFCRCCRSRRLIGRVKDSREVGRETIYSVNGFIRLWDEIRVQFAYHHRHLIHSRLDSGVESVLG